MVVMSPSNQERSQVSDISWKVSNLNTKIRINEQNILNQGKRLQLFNKNFLNFKTEVRGKIDIMLKNNRELQTTMENLNKAIIGLEKRMKHYPKKEEVDEIKKIQKSVNVYNPTMSKKEADNILDDILKKTKPIKA